MKATKLELQQHMNRLTAENVELRAKVAAHAIEIETRDNKITELSRRLGEADHRARKLIAQANRSVGDSTKRDAMNAAREAAMRLGRVVRVGGN